MTYPTFLMSHHFENLFNSQLITTLKVLKRTFFYTIETISKSTLVNRDSHHVRKEINLTVAINYNVDISHKTIS